MDTLAAPTSSPIFTEVSEVKQQELWKFLKVYADTVELETITNL